MRYLVFAGDRYYPGGGMSDLVGEAVSIEEARELGIEEASRHGTECGWYQITEGGTVIEKRDGLPEREPEAGQVKP